jgi:hypothetical protein
MIYVEKEIPIYKIILSMLLSGYYKAPNQAVMPDWG